MILLKLFALTLSFILLSQPVFAQTMGARVEFNKNASTVNGMVPEGSEGEYLSSTLLKATANREAVYYVKIRLMKVPAGSRLKPGDEVWAYHRDSTLNFTDRRGRTLENVENTLFQSKATQAITGSGKPAPVAKPPPPPPPIPAPEPAPVTKLKAPTFEPRAMPLSAPGADPNEAMPIKGKRETVADFCPSGRCMSRGAQEEIAITEVETINKALARQQAGTVGASQWSSDPVVSRYSNDPKVLKMIAIGKRKSKKYSTGACFLEVKMAALAAGVVDSKPGGGHAVNGRYTLKEHGFINMLDNPKYKSMIKDADDAPKGAILVYRNVYNSKLPGHIEIKTDHGEKGGYVSDFYRDGSTTRLKGRALVAVMIQENP